VLAITSEVVEEHRQRLLEEIELIGEVLKSPTVVLQPLKDHVNGLLKILDRMARLLGVDLVLSQKVDEPDLHPDAVRMREGKLPVSAQSWLTASRLFEGGLIELRGGGEIRVTQKGISQGFQFDDDWMDKWSDFGSLSAIEAADDPEDI